MAEAAARLLLPPVSAPTVETTTESDYHTPQFASFAASLLWSGERRFEAETYLTSGYGLRLAIEAQPQGWARFDTVARVWQPSRLKGIQVGPQYGTPFLAATQVFDLRPVPRKWLALERTSDATNRFLSPGDIVVTCSGTVGRVTLAHAPHENTLISHDLLRVEARNAEQWGWIYAYLRSPQARAMMNGVQYGHMIKHLETGHLGALPIPLVKAHIAADSQTRVEAILEARNEGQRFVEEAEARFSEIIGPLNLLHDEVGYSVSSNAFSKKRRRFEASHYSPISNAIINRFNALSVLIDPLNGVAAAPYSMGRKKIYLGEGGIRYLSADEIFAINPIESKRVLVAPDDGHEAHFVKEGWIVMACSGQIYGLNGSAMLVTKEMENIFFSQDLIRIIPNEEKIRPGYLLTALTHPVLGRPLLIRAAYGTSIPHLDPKDVATFPVVRLNNSDEDAIADLAEAAAASRSRADVLERALASDAGVLLDHFIAGNLEEFQT